VCVCAGDERCVDGSVSRRVALIESGCEMVISARRPACVLEAD
jgi:hypothetical protein